MRLSITAKWSMGFSKSLKNKLWFMLSGAEVAQIGRAPDSTATMLGVKLKTGLSPVQVRPSAPQTFYGKSTVTGNHISKVHP